MFSRSFWRFIALASAAGAGVFLARSFRKQPIPLPDKTKEAVRTAARKTVRRATAKLEDEAGDGDGRRAH
jgi:hypothetical protein